MTGIIGKLRDPTLRWCFSKWSNLWIWWSKWRPRDVTVFSQQFLWKFIWFELFLIQHCYTERNFPTYYCEPLCMGFSFLPDCILEIGENDRYKNILQGTTKQEKVNRKLKMFIKMCEAVNLSVIHHKLLLNFQTWPPYI